MSARAPDPPGEHLPDAEAALAALADRMRSGVAHDAAFVGIYSGGAWLADGGIGQDVIPLCSLSSDAGMSPGRSYRRSIEPRA